jgi:type VI protein secretion system component VasK
MPRVTSRIALIIVLCIALIFGTWFAYGAWQRNRAASLQAKIDKGQIDAGLKSGKEAVNTVGNNADNANAIDKTVKEGTNAIANAPAGNSNDTALREACKLRSFSGSDRCRQLLQPAGADGVGERRPDR